MYTSRTHSFDYISNAINIDTIAQQRSSGRTNEISVFASLLGRNGRDDERRSTLDNIVNDRLILIVIRYGLKWILRKVPEDWHQSVEQRENDTRGPGCDPPNQPALATIIFGGSYSRNNARLAGQ